MLLVCLPATHLVSWCLEARVGISKNRAKEERKEAENRGDPERDLQGEGDYSASWGADGEGSRPNSSLLTPGFCRGSGLPVSLTLRFWLFPLLTQVPHTYSL